MTIIDAQVHIWPPETPERLYITEDASKPHQPIPLTRERLLEEMAAAQVDRAILVPPSWEGYRNDYALQAARLHSDRFAVMGKVALDDPASKSKLATWVDQPGMLGFRISFRHSGTHSFLDDGTADWFWRDCERYDIPVMIFAPFCVGKIGEIAERHPGLRVIVDHMGLNVQWKGKDLGAGVDVVLRFARLANIAVKASCLPCYVNEPYPYPRLHPQIRRVIEAFGPQRVFWGTDLSQLPCSYRQVVTLFTEHLDFLSSEDLEWIMGKAIARWLRWPSAERPTDHSEHR
jgi:L-fuconolactonase